MNNKTAIVTGSSRGIGKRLAERLAQDGFNVVVSYNNQKAKADEVVTGIATAGGKAIAIQADVANENAVANLFEAAEEKFGGIDVVVHAAAILQVKPLIELSFDEINSVIRTNLLGTFVVNQQAAKKVRNGGVIINISSAITNNLAIGYSAYAASKAGLEALTKVLARELGSRNITVNAIAPGPTETEMLANDLANRPNGEQMRQAIIGMTALGRIGTPDDIAEVVLAFSGNIRWITGQVIHTSGGIVI